MRHCRACVRSSSTLSIGINGGTYCRAGSAMGLRAARLQSSLSSISTQGPALQVTLLGDRRLAAAASENQDEFLVLFLDLSRDLEAWVRDHWPAA
jgi:hypothetical protein